MKAIWNFLIGWADSITRARAAAELTRRGQHQAARNLMLND